MPQLIIYLFIFLVFEEASSLPMERRKYALISVHLGLIVAEIAFF